MAGVHDAFVKLSAMKYADQAIWFLNVKKKKISPPLDFFFLTCFLKQLFHKGLLG